MSGHYRIHYMKCKKARYNCLYNYVYILRNLLQIKLMRFTIMLSKPI